MSWLRTAAIVPLIGLTAFLPLSHGQNEIHVLDVPDSVIDFLVPVTVPPSYCAAVGDAFGWLALGHRSGTSPHQVSLFRLDPQGKPAATPVALTLPRPATLGNIPSYPLGLVFHPKLPLLYVWQDFQAEKPNENLAQPGLNEFDHLLIYQLSDPAPKLLQALCRGVGYGHGNFAGTLALNATANRLYVPNLRPNLKTPTIGAVAYLDLDAAGLPVSPSTAADKANPYPEVRRHSPANSHYYYLPAGVGFHLVSDDMVIVGLPNGPATWDMGNRRAWSNQLLPAPIVGAGYLYRSAGHPTLPVVFSSTLGHSWACRMEHADGYLTLAPQRAALDGVTLHSYPIVLARRNQVAFGGINKVYLIGLDDQGRFKNSRVQAVVVNPKVEALVYSEKFDRLYVTVEKGK